MIKKNIELKIKAKLKEWLSSIKNKDLAKDLKDNIIVSGGAIASMLLNEKVNDYDIYIRNRDVLERLIKYYMNKYGWHNFILLDGRSKLQYLQHYYNMVYLNNYNSEELNDDYNNLTEFLHSKTSKNLKKQPKEELKQHSLDFYMENIENTNGYIVAVKNLKDEQLKLFNLEGMYKADILKLKEKYSDNENLTGIYEPFVITSNAITLTNDIQIIIRFFGDVDEIHKTYDFVHATNYFTFKTGLVLNVDALESLINKQLYYRGSLYPLTSIIRTRKFLKRDFNISASEYLKMAFQISQIDLSDPAVLEEQLMGVDVVYFNMLIDDIRNELKGKKHINYEWLVQKLDKIFYEND